LTKVVRTIIVMAERWTMTRHRKTATGAGKAAAESRKLGEEGVVRVLRLANRITQEANGMLRDHGLTLNQYNALRILRGAGDGGATCGQIAERMLTRDPDVTRLIDRLVRAGWATRERDTSDRRVVTTRITTSGLSLLAGLDAEVAGFDRALFGAVDDGRLGDLVETLKAVLGE
jgi:DNA-binding MarR family transcriptional regulator